MTKKGNTILRKMQNEKREKQATCKFNYFSMVAGAYLPGNHYKIGLGRITLAL